MRDPGAEATDKAREALEKRIRSVYREAQKDIQAKLDDFTQRFKVKDAMYQKQLKEGKITQAQYQQWLRGQVFQSDRWKQKLEQITTTLNESNKVAMGIINGEVNGIFAHNANWQSYTLEHGAGLNFGFEIHDSSTVARLLRDEPGLLPKKKVNIPKDKAWNRKKITRQITQGIIQGESLDKIAKRLQKVTDMNRNTALTNAQTAMTGAQNAGRQESLNRAVKMGVQVKKEWLATLDGHTRTEHGQLDGQKVDVDKPFRIGGYTIAYPGDPHAHPAMIYNCRCTLIGDLVKYPSKDAKRYDNIDGKPIKDMTFSQWLKAKEGGKIKEEPPKVEPFSQVGIGVAKSVQEVCEILNNAGIFKANSRGVYNCDLTGCDLDSAKSIASAYQQVFERYPQLKGKFGVVSAKNLGNRTYAQCWMRSGGRIDVNNSKGFYSNWSNVVKSYERDVLCDWHPFGTTAESIVVHEIGHAVDGYLAKKGILGGYNASGEFRYASSLLRNRIMKECGLSVKDSASAVSQYGSTNPQEWFAEAFAEYITSANPRPVAAALGRKLEELLKGVK